MNRVVFPGIVVEIDQVSYRRYLREYWGKRARKCALITFMAIAPFIVEYAYVHHGGVAKAALTLAMIALLIAAMFVKKADATARERDSAHRPIDSNLVVDTFETPMRRRPQTVRVATQWVVTITSTSAGLKIVHAQLREKEKEVIIHAPRVI